MTSITFITGNAKKFAEAAAMVPGLLQRDLDLPELQSLDPHEVIRAKLEAARALHMGPCVVEDTSLSLACLNGLPGTLIKWFLATVGNAGLVRLAEALGDDRAEARTVVGYADEAGAVHFFAGSVSGRVKKSDAPSAFGWDPIFYPDTSPVSYAAMGVEAKNAISMRRKAFAGLAAHCAGKDVAIGA